MSIKLSKPSHLKLASFWAAISLAGFAQQGFAAGAPAPNALPTGGKVVAGTAAITQAGNTMNINQSSQRAVINWNSFDVGSKSTVNFNQPNAQAATLNQVNGATKSMINGAVNANGQVIFVNNNGVVFGKGAEVNVGGMVATTMNTSSADFMAGKDIQSFEGGNANGKVINKGNITGNNINSYIALMAPQVKNTGVITATLSGNNAVALVSGQKVNLTFSGSQLVSVSVDASVVNSLISNKLLINAGSGQVIIAANAAQDLMGSVIKNTGTISASGINTSAGKITLTADAIEQSGIVEANSAQSKGGEVSLKGANIDLKAGSKTTATGAIAGGMLNIGVNNSSKQTIAAAVQNNDLASTVSIQNGAIVDASATQNGNGGSINVWSKFSTFIAGSLFSKGGAQGGNGGKIETSSRGNVSIATSAVIDTSASRGRTGLWVIDPVELIIDASAAAAISNALNTTSVTLDATVSSCIGFGPCSQTQSPLIRLMAGADIYSANTSTALNLIATGGQIDVDGNITAGQVYAVAQVININGSINTNGGSSSNIYLAGAIINILGNINSNGNSQNNSSSNNLNLANTSTANNRRNGQNGLNADNNIYYSNGGAINILSTGDITLGANASISANGLNGGVINIVSATGKITINGVIDAVGKNGNGGLVSIAGKTQTDLIGALISSEGLSQGGVINLGQVNNLSNGSTLAPPANAPPALTSFIASSIQNNSNSFQVLSQATSLDSNSGISASSTNGNGGQIYIAGNNSLDTAALIQANGSNGGFIVMSSPAGTYQNTGYIQTNGGAGLGGTIAQSGLISTTLTGVTIEANGQLGGGNLLVGRDFKTNPLPGSVTESAALPSLNSVIALPTSQIAIIDQNSTLSANAIYSGNGGNVLSWGDGLAAVGVFTSKGGAVSGNGGLIETSGNQLIVDGITVDSTAAYGRSGKWLLDPTSVTINSTASTGGSLASALAFAGATTINATDLQNAINAGNSVTIVTSGSISMAGSVPTLSFINNSGTDATLTFDNHSASGQSMTLKSITATGTSITNLVVISSGGALGLSLGSISVTGSITLDNTYQVGVANSSGYLLNSANVTSSTVPTGGIGVGGLTAGTFVAINASSRSQGGALTVGGSMLSSQRVAGNGIDINMLQNGPFVTGNPVALNVSGNGISMGSGTASIVGGDINIQAKSTGILTSGQGNMSIIAYGADVNLGNSTTAMIGAVGGVIGNNMGVYNLTNITATKVAGTGGNVNINVISNGSGSAYLNVAGNTITADANVEINAQNTSSTSSGSPAFSFSGLIKSNNGSIDIVGTSAGTAAVSIGALTITAGAGDLSVVGNLAAAGGSTGITQTGAITDNSNGGDITFTSNNKINQAGAIALVGNTSGAASSVTYDTTSGTSASTITSGALSLTGATSTSAINYIETTNGAQINTAAVAMPGYIQLDNTCSGCATPITPALAATRATALVGVSVTGALNAGNGVTINGASSGANGITTTAAITSVNGVAINGISTVGGSFGGVTLTSVTNSGTNGVTASATGNLRLSTGATDTGTGGINLTGGYLIAAGTTTGGTISAVGTLSNSGGGVISLSMAQPTSSTGGTIETAAGIVNASPTGSQALASTATNVAYSLAGGTMSSSHTGVNNVNYRSTTPSFSASIALTGSYVQPYGTAYDGSVAQAWLSATGGHTSVTSITGGGFGMTAPTNTALLNSLYFASNLGSTANSNNVTAAVTLAGTGKIQSTLGYPISFTTTAASPSTYTITAAPLVITFDSGSYVPNGSTTYAAVVSGVGFTASGLVTTIGGVATSDAVATAAISGTPVFKTGNVVGSGTSLSATAPASQVFNYAPSSSTAGTSTGAGLSNYSITYVGNVFTLPVITVTASVQTKVYGNTTATNGVVYSLTSNTVTAADNLLGYTLSGASLPVGVSVSGVTLTSSGGATGATIAGGPYTITPSTLTVTGGSISGWQINYVTGQMTITPKPITVTPTATYVYGASPATTMASGTTISGITYSSPGFVGGDGVTSANLTFTNGSALNNIPANTSVGTYNSALTATSSPSPVGTGASNYTFTFAPGNVTITPATLSINANNATKNYGAQVVPLGTEFSSSGLVSGDTISSVTLTSSGYVNTATVAGSTYTITPSAAIGSGLSNYNIVYNNGALTVNPATLTITASSDTKIYGSSTTTAGVVYNPSGVAAAAGNTVGYSVSGLLNSDVVTGVALTSSGGPATANASGTPYSVVPSGVLGTGLSNYTLSYVNGGLTVNPATVAISNVSMVYNGGTTLTPGSGVTYTATGANGQTITLGGSGATLTNGDVLGGSAANSTSGLTIAGVSGGGSSGNYVLPAAIPVVTITPAPITVILADQTKQYDSTLNAALIAGTSSSSTGSYTISGFVGGQGAYIDQTVGTYNNVNVAGATSVTASLSLSNFIANVGTNFSNYSLPASVTNNASAITPASLIMTANNATTYIGQSVPTSSLTYTISGLVGSDTPTSALSGASVSNGGTVNTSGVQSGVLVPSVTAPNYTVTTINGDLTVLGQNQLTITVGASSVVYGAYNQTQVNDGTVSSQAQNVSSGYCTNCIANPAPGFIPNIISLTVTAPSSPGGLWIAADSQSGSAQGRYSFTVTPSVSSYSNTGSYVNVGNYALTPGNVQTVSGYATNYDTNKPVIYTYGTLTVTPLILTFSAAAPTIGYNGATAFTGASLSPNNLPAGYSSATLTVTGNGSFTSPNASTSAAYAISSVDISGADAANFAFSSSAAGTTGNTGVITPAAITVSSSNAVKTYDATLGTSGTNVSVNPTPVLVGGTLYTNNGTGLQDALSGGTYVYANSNVLGANQSTVNVSAVDVLNGSSSTSGNYAITYQSNTTSTISPAVITISGATIYNGSDSTTALTATGVNGQTLALSGGAGVMTSANAGINGLTSIAGTLSLANGSGANAGLASNYTVVNPTLASVVVSPLAIIVTASDATKVYDATTSAPTTTVGSTTIAPAPLLTSSSAALIAGHALNGGAYSYLNPNVLGVNQSEVSVSGVAILNGSTNVTSNYSITYANNTSSTINPATVVINGSTTYNGSTTVGTLTATGVNGQTLVVNGATGTMNSVDAGTNSLTSISSGGSLGAAGVNPGNPSNYTIVNPTLGTVSVAQAAITVTASNTVKTYDTSLLTSGSGVTTEPAAVLLSGTLYGADALSGGTFAFTDPNAGSGNKTVTVSSVSVQNGLSVVSSNYAITYVSNTTSTINPAQLTISGLSAASSVDYNGGTAIGISGTPVLSGVLPGAPVSITSGAVTQGSLAGANVANGVAITPNLSSLQIDNPNYVIAGLTSALTTNITPLQLTAVIVGSPTMTYNGTTITTGLGSANYTLSGFLSGQGATVSQATANYNSPDVAAASTLTATLTPSNFTAGSGTLLSNYILPVSATGAGTISPATLTMTASTASTFLGVAPTLTGSTAYALTGLVGADTAATAISGPAVTNNASVNVPGTFAGALVPSATSSNYMLIFVSGALSVAAADQLVVSVNAGSNIVVYGVYSSTNISTAGQSLSPAGVTAAYCTNCASNMGGTTPNIVNLTITAPSSGSNLWTASDNVAPGTSAQGIYTFVINPVIPSGSYSTSGYVKAGDYALVPSGISTVPGQATNYNVNQPVVYTNGALTVTPLTMTFASGPTTTYNGTTAINSATLAPSNMLAGDVMTVAVNGTLGSPNANAGNASYALTSALIAGADASNYVFSNAASGASGTNATVSPAPISISASNTAKIYDATTSTNSSSVSITPSPLIVSGTLFTNSLTGVADSISAVDTVYSDAVSANAPNVGSGNKTVTVSNAVIVNGVNGANTNYAITYVNNTTSTINPAPLTISGITSPGSVVYNGSNAISISGTPTLEGSTFGATVGFSGTPSVTLGTLADPNVASNIAVTPDLSSLVLNNPNFYIAGPTNALASTVSPAPLTISGLTAAGIVYNGTTSTSITGTPSLVGAIIGTPSVTIGSGSVSTGIFASANVSPVVGVTPDLSALVLSGPGAANYSIVGVTTPLSATITPAILTVSISSQAKQYDANTNAVLIAGGSGTAGSFVISGLAAGESAYITQTVGNYNSANVLDATSITALLNPANFVSGNSSTLLSNYILPSSASGVGSMTPAPLTMTANNTATFIGVAPVLAGAFTLTGLQGADSAATALSGASVSNANTASSAGVYANTLVPSGSSSNYSLTFANGDLTIASNYQLVVAAGTKTVSFGSYDQSQVVNGAVGAQMSTGAAVAPTAQYCTNCGVGVNNPTYVNLTLTAPITGSTQWTAADAIGVGTSSQGIYNFTLTPTVPTGSYSSGNYLKVGNYVVAPSGVAAVAGQTTNFNAALPVVYMAGNLAVTPLVLQLATPNPLGSSSTGGLVPTMQYNGTRNVNNVTLSVANLPTGMSALTVTGSGNYSSPNAANNVPVNITGALISGNDADNFVFSGPISGAGVITPAPIIVSASNTVKSYDNSLGTTGSNASVLSAPLLVSGTLYAVNGVQDTLSGGTYAYLDPNAGSGNKTISVAGVSVLNGSSDTSSNYTVSYQNNTTSTITPAQITISGLTAINRLYDTTTTASISGTPTIAGNTFGVSLSLNGGVTSGIFASINAGNGIYVIPNLLALTLNNPNFVIAGLSSPLTANIIPSPLTVDWASSPTTIAGLNGQNLGINSAGALVNGTGANAGLASNYVILNPKPTPNPVPDNSSTSSQTINNMGVLTNQLELSAISPNFVTPAYRNYIRKPEYIYVRDNDDLNHYFEAVEVPTSGAFKFPVPDQVIQDLINSSGENIAAATGSSPYKLLLISNGGSIMATMADGTPLMDDVRYDQGAKTFYIPNLSQVNLPLTLKLNLTRGGAVVVEKLMVVTK